MKTLSAISVAAVLFLGCGGQALPEKTVILFAGHVYLEEAQQFDETEIGHIFFDCKAFFHKSATNPDYALVSAEPVTPNNQLVKLYGQLQFMDGKFVCHGLLKSWHRDGAVIEFDYINGKAIGLGRDSEDKKQPVDWSSN